MKELLESDRFTLESKVRWFPALTKRFNIINEQGENIGIVIFHPAWMFPILWLAGLLIELGLVAGGIWWMYESQGRSKVYGLGIAILGLLMFLFFKLRDFLSSRAPSSIEIVDRNNTTVLTGRKGWAVWRPTVTITRTQDGQRLGQSKQSLFWGDCHYTIWDDQGETWGSVRRRPFGFQYRVFRDDTQVARFRRLLVDARKMITGMRSYRLEYETDTLAEGERDLIFGTMAYADVMVREKKLRQSRDQKIAKQKKQSKE